LTGADTGTPSSVTAKCTLEYTPGFEVLFLVAAILVAALLVRRRKN
jgi:PGF-CTERM protein